MAWIRVIEEHEAEGDLKEYYDELREVARTKLGKEQTGVHQIRKVMSLRGGAFMRTFDQLVRMITFGGSVLGGVREEMVAVVVSNRLRCPY